MENTNVYRGSKHAHHLCDVDAVQAPGERVHRHEQRYGDHQRWRARHHKCDADEVGAPSRREQRHESAENHEYARLVDAIGRRRPLRRNEAELGRVVGEQVVVSEESGPQRCEEHRGNYHMATGNRPCEANNLPVLTKNDR